MVYTALHASSKPIFVENQGAYAIKRSRLKGFFCRKTIYNYLKLR